MYGDELLLLAACREAVRRQQELASALAAHLHVPLGELYYRWAVRQFAQRGTIEGGEWRYFFHGMECDLFHNADGRALRLDFGPGGRVDTFCGWGLLRFILHARDPWPEFAELKCYLTDGLAAALLDYDALSHLGILLDRVAEQGWVDKADPELFRFAEAHTHRNAEGIGVLKLPAGSPERLSFDVAVCHRLAITSAGYRMLGEEPPAERRSDVFQPLEHLETE